MAIIDLIISLAIFTLQHSSLLINSKKPYYLSYQSAQQIIIMTVWYLNFCAPFLYDTSGTPQTIRYILYISLIIEFLTYVFFIAKYKLFGRIFIFIQNKSLSRMRSTSVMNMRMDYI